MKRLSYIQDARCLKVNTSPPRPGGAGLPEVTEVLESRAEQLSCIELMVMAYFFAGGIGAGTLLVLPATLQSQRTCVLGHVHSSRHAGD